jgi:hypothetical protein
MLGGEDAELRRYQEGSKLGEANGKKGCYLIAQLLLLLMQLLLLQPPALKLKTKVVWHGQRWTDRQIEARAHTHTKTRASRRRCRHRRILKVNDQNKAKRG